MRFYLFIVLVVLVSCRKNNQEQISEDYKYQPVSIGHSVIYKVDSIYIDSKIGIRDTATFYLKETITDTFRDNSNRLTHRVVIQKADSLNGLMFISDVWSINLLDRSLEKMEENQKFVKLSFPIATGQKWEGNSFVDTDLEEFEYLEDWIYEYVSIHAQNEVNGVQFDSTIIIDQADFRSDHFWYYGKEIYAKNIGLVSKDLYFLKSNETLTSEEEWLKNAEKGFIITYRYIEI